MQAGKLIHRIAIQSVISMQDPVTGAVSEDWVDVVTVWASIVPLSGREFIAAQATQAGVTARIIIRFRDGLTESMRIKHGSDYYNIKAILPDPSLRSHLTIMAERGVING